jgi:beta-carotene/zeaxanthin 4-ketolase
MGLVAENTPSMTAASRGFTHELPLQVAMTIVGVWAISLWRCTQLQLEAVHPIWLVCAIGWQTWIYTGLFITAHDAMHGSVHSSSQINRSIGQLCLWLYAGFEYSQLFAKHQLHHKYPASDRDPDFHDGNTSHFWGWYAQFVCEHISWRQLFNLGIILGLYVAVCRFSTANLVLFWIVPSLLSSLQLFYFGTFLPHRELPTGYDNRHRARTIARSTWWSLISCYHFGYHREHHESPHISWWRLYKFGV